MAVERTTVQPGKSNERLKSVFEKQRQAVVVIHGIGNQRPMETLRPFVDAILDVDPATSKYYSKPDELSNTFELRRLQSKDSRPRTDYFELYWQHLVPTATWRKMYDWLTLLLARPVHTVPPPLRKVWLLSWIISISILVLLGLTLLGWLFPQLIPAFLSAPKTTPLGPTAILALIQGLILNYVGDAATYLSANPDNIQARQAVRDAGVRLLERLHKAEAAGLGYDRIIIVGHSLGSMIGYDILTHAWPRFNEAHGSPECPERTELAAAQRVAQKLWTEHGNIDQSSSMSATTDWLRATRRLWLEQRVNRFPWLVTDFITLGSPLSHALLLLARNQADLQRKQVERELPTCPPQLDRDGTFSFPVNYVINEPRRRTIHCLHHAALFAQTRWTNLFFPARWMVWGDLIGGPVRPAFGPGVVDIPVGTTTRGGWLAHTSYWQRGKRYRGATKSAIEALIVALDIKRATFKAAESPSSGTENDT